MTERERVIGDAYTAFRSARKLPADTLVIEVVNMVLQASGADAMNPAEVRLVDCHVRCSWDKWTGTAAAAVKPDPSDWPGWPADGTPANATASPRGQDGPGPGAKDGSAGRMAPRARKRS